MNNILVGNNSSGKTLYLRKLCNEFSADSVNSNLVWPRYYDNTPYNEERIGILEDVITDRFSPLEIARTDLGLDFICEYTFSSDFKQIASLICRDKPILILDEPECGLSYGAETYTFSDFLHRVCSTYSTVWMATHWVYLLDLQDVQKYTVRIGKDASDLYLIPAEEKRNYNEYFD